MNVAVNDIFATLEFEYGMQVVSISRSKHAPWRLEIEVAANESTLEQYLNSAVPYQVTLAA
jgi:hypothetical protein